MIGFSDVSLTCEEALSAPGQHLDNVSNSLQFKDVLTRTVNRSLNLDIIQEDGDHIDMNASPVSKP